MTFLEFADAHPVLYVVTLLIGMCSVVGVAQAIGQSLGKRG